MSDETTQNLKQEPTTEQLATETPAKGAALAEAPATIPDQDEPEAPPAEA